MSMEELVLNRLMDLAGDRERAMQRRFEALSAEFEHIKRERDSLRGTVAEHQKSEKPLRDLFYAAEAVWKAKSSRQRGRAMSHLGSCMCFAEPFIDEIPF